MHPQQSVGAPWRANAQAPPCGRAAMRLCEGMEGEEASPEGDSRLAEGDQAS